MNRRSFLKFAGLAPVVPLVAVDVLRQLPIVEFDELITHFCMYRLQQHQSWNINDHIGKDGILNVFIKNGNMWKRHYFDIKICHPIMEIVNEIKNKDLTLHYSFLDRLDGSSTLEFRNPVKHQDNYYNQLEVVCLQIEFNSLTERERNNVANYSQLYPARIKS